MSDKIFLGTYATSKIYVSKHSWDCGWYWSFGYLGNKDCHYHFETYLQHKEPFTGARLDTYAIAKVFTNTWLTQDDWWVLLDLFRQAYALKDCAAVYRYGGFMTTLTGVTDILQDTDKAAQCNADLERLLETIWAYLHKLKARR
jgi:hypothetical protein